MHNFGFGELFLIFGIAVLLFGSRLPAMGKALGEGIRNFKRGLGGLDEPSSGTQNGNNSSTQTGPSAPQPGVLTHPHTPHQIPSQPVNHGSSVAQHGQVVDVNDLRDPNHRNT